MKESYASILQRDKQWGKRVKKPPDRIIFQEKSVLSQFLAKIFFLFLPSCSLISYSAYHHVPRVWTGQDRKVVKMVKEEKESSSKGITQEHTIFYYYFGRQKQLRGNKLWKSLCSFLPEKLSVLLIWSRFIIKSIKLSFLSLITHLTWFYCVLYIYSHNTWPHSTGSVV